MQRAPWGRSLAREARNVPKVKVDLGEASGLGYFGGHEIYLLLSRVWKFSASPCPCRQDAEKFFKETPERSRD